MLKFFRKIRQGLLTENKSGKYLFYAIGEIILVVIGILIALSINNWNEGQQHKKEEQRILQELLNDYEKDILQLTNHLGKSKIRGKQLDTLMTILSQTENYDKDKFLQLSFNGLGFEGYFKVNSGAYDESIAAGSIKFISNSLLRQKVFDYYRDAKINYTDENSQKQVYESIFTTYFQKIMATQEVMNLFGMPSRVPQLDIYELGMDVEFMSIVIQKKAMEGFQSQDWNKFLENARKIQVMIREELNME